MQAIQSQDTVKIRGLIDKIDDQEDEINALIGVVIQQDIQIQSLVSKSDATYVKENKNNILINSIPETPGEDCYHEASNFFKNILQVEKPIPLTQAYRIGRGNKRPILAKLKNVSEKAAIYGKTDRLKEINKARDKPYYITDQLPESYAEQRRTNNFLKQLSAKLPMPQRKNAEIKKGVLTLDGTPYVPPIHPPTVAEICSFTPEKKRMLHELDISQGDTEMHQKSVFTGYAADVFSTETVQKLYDAICLKVPDATHVVCAFKLPGIDIATTQGFVDNCEYGAGRVLLNLLNKTKAVNKAIFVTRHYGGQHIGALRFQLIEKVADSALQQVIAVEQCNRKPLTDEELRELNQQIQQQAEQREQDRLQQLQNPWNIPGSSKQQLEDWSASPT